MTETLVHESHVPSQPKLRLSPAQRRAKTVRLLRDLAFVLKMTERVREEMETEREARTSAMA